MKLPPLLVFTDRRLCRGDLRATVAVAVAYGARAVVLRDRDLPEAERDRLAADLRPVLAVAGGILLIAGTRGAAVHLSAGAAFPRPRPTVVGRSCHSLAEVTGAAAEGCDYVTVSPVFRSASKPGYGPPLGLAGLAALSRGAPRGYALGGVRPDDVPDCRRAGAYGVAVMGPVMSQPETVAAYLAALEEVPA